MEAFQALLTAWGAVTLGLLLVLTLILYNENDGFTFWGAVRASAVVALAVFLIDPPMNWWLSVYIAAYLVIGVIWSMYKWQRCATRIYKKLQEALEKSPLPQTGLKNDWADWVRSFAYNHPNVMIYFHASDVMSDKRFELNPRNPDNLERLMEWMAFWPISLLDYIVSTLLHDFFEWFASSFWRVYAAIADRVLSPVNQRIQK